MSSTDPCATKEVRIKCFMFMFYVFGFMLFYLISQWFDCDHKSLILILIEKLKLHHKLKDYLITI